MKTFVGIDLGSTTTKAVLLDENCDVIGRGITNSRSNYARRRASPARRRASTAASRCFAARCRGRRGSTGELDRLPRCAGAGLPL